MTTYAIEAKNITKKFGKFTALDKVSLFAKKGKVTGLLGPNGAGKTTLIRAMTTLLDFKEGSIVVDGVDVHKFPNEARKRIGLAGQFAAVDDFLTGRESLEMVARLYGIPRKKSADLAHELLEKLGLSDAADRQAKTYSGGMKRRLDLAASLVATPKVLFLDEPTTGLDPRTRLQLWGVIRDLVEQGVSILLTTQYLEEADALCDYIYVIDKGKMIVEGTAGQLKDSLGKDIIELKPPSKQLEKSHLSLIKAGYDAVVDALTGRITMHAAEGADDLLKVAALLKKQSIKPEELSLHRPTLDDVFLTVTGERSEK